ncbi:MAG: selenocysteine-specific translation elongation factor, partial [bacterium]
MQIVVGTAGHIDHGKTALVKALTGTDTDRLAEEKARGMTIDLGFAYLDQSITIIDVPGHEKFIRNMVAGVSTIHIALLVIAADDGIMPQTKEHLHILKLLGVKQGIIALTKTDLADDHDWIDLVELEIQDLVADTFLKDAPIVRTSIETGEGTETLKQTILTQSKNIETVLDRGFFHLPVDRVFSKKGFGSVVTGTVLSGKTKIGSDLEIIPGNQKAKVRGIQTHGTETSSVKMRDRAAINLAGTDLNELYRGTVIADPYWVNSTK